MYRILKADKDSYVTNKAIYSARGGFTSSIYSNVGQAGTIDLFKLYKEGGNSGIELSRAVIHFNLDPIRELTGSLVNINDTSFKCYVNLKDVYGGQTVPSNFDLILYPLAKEFEEGRGNDVIGYRDLDAVNWVTASLNGINSWTTGGIGASGSAGDIITINSDYYTFYTSSIGYLPLGFTQHFDRGDEDLLIDVTTAISATLAGGIPDYGFRLSYSGSQETDSVTRFVKRFSSRQSRNTNLHPRLIIKYNDTFIDNQAQTYFDVNNKIGIYNSPYGNPTNFLSGAIPVSGSGSVLLKLFASQSSYVTATTYSYSHQATISYLSTSWSYFSQSFTGSQISFGGINQSGSYYADVCIPFNASGLSSVINGNSVVFNSLWTSLDQSVVYTTGSNFTMMALNASNASIPQKNYAINITNLQDVYNDKDVAKLRVFAYDFDPTLTSFYIPYDVKPKIFKTMYWSVIDPYSKEIIIPFDDSGTQLSADGKGMYFNLYMQDLPINRPLEIKLLIKEYGNSSLVENQAFIFKIVDV